MTELPAVSALRSLERALAAEEAILEKAIQDWPPSRRKKINEPARSERNWEMDWQIAASTCREIRRAIMYGPDLFAQINLMSLQFRLSDDHPDMVVLAAWGRQVERLAVDWLGDPNPLLAAADIVYDQLSGYLRFTSGQDLTNPLGDCLLLSACFQSALQLFAFHSSEADEELDDFSDNYPDGFLRSLIDLPELLLRGLRRANALSARENVGKAAKDSAAYVASALPMCERLADEAGAILAGHPTFSAELTDRHIMDLLED